MTFATIYCFNPVLGFLPVATFFYRLSALLVSPFQSRAGFSARRDNTEGDCVLRWFGFNPVLGFLPVATAQLFSGE